MKKSFNYQGGLLVLLLCATSSTSVALGVPSFMKNPRQASRAYLDRKFKESIQALNQIQGSISQAYGNWKQNIKVSPETWQKVRTGLKVAGAAILAAIAAYAVSRGAQYFGGQEEEVATGPTASIGEIRKQYSFNTSPGWWDTMLFEVVSKWQNNFNVGATIAEVRRDLDRVSVKGLQASIAVADFLQKRKFELARKSLIEELRVLLVKKLKKMETEPVKLIVKPPPSLVTPPMIRTP